MNEAPKHIVQNALEFDHLEGSMHGSDLSNLSSSDSTLDSSTNPFDGYLMPSTVNGTRSVFILQDTLPLKPIKISQNISEESELFSDEENLVIIPAAEINRLLKMLEQQRKESEDLKATKAQLEHLINDG
ncbi:MAG: hypothetical protein LBJ61_02985 [Deltaproteobacteria bacterium]|jgi:hypothetical protein|nr:hypothetical protein [Deltaproteobacteria bacterium]